MCVSTFPESRMCGICVKLKSLLRIHIKFHHPSHARTLFHEKGISRKELDISQIKKARVRKKRKLKSRNENEKLLKKFDDDTDNEVYAFDQGETENQNPSTVKRDSSDDKIEVKNDAKKARLQTESSKTNDTNSEPIVIKPTLNSMKSGTRKSIKDRVLKRTIAQNKPKKVPIKKSKLKTIHVSIEKKSSAAKARKSYFDCDFCNRTFRFQRGLDKHKRTAHPDTAKLDTLNEIKFIDKVSSVQESSDDFNQNLPLSNEVPKTEPLKTLEKCYSCTICNKTYAKKRYLDRHYKIAHKDSSHLEDEEQLRAALFDTYEEEELDSTAAKNTPKKKKVPTATLR